MNLKLSREISPRAAGALVVLALIATVVASREAPTPRPDIPAPSDILPARQPAAMAGLDLSRLQRRADTPTEPAGNLFAQRISGPLAPPGPSGTGGNGQDAGPVAAIPTAPALPFQYLGKLTENRRLQVFLMKDASLYTVAAGQVLENLYKVERVTEESVTFTYLPLGTSQILEIRASAT